MISSIYFCREKLPSNRLITALCLYYDQLTIPLSYTPDEEQYKEVFHKMPSSIKDVILQHNKFVECFKGLSPKVLNIPCSLRVLTENKKCEKLFFNGTLLIANALPELQKQFMFEMNEFYALGYYHSILDFYEESSNSALVPISDHDVIGISLHPRADASLADILSSWLALEAIQLSLPDLEAIHPSEILWTRERLAEELSDFRDAMYRLAVDLRELVKDETHIDRIRSEALFISKTHIIPAVHALQKAIKLHKKAFSNRILVKALDTLKLIVKYCYAPDPFKVANLASSAVQGALDFSHYCDEIAKLNNESAMSYLVKLPNEIEIAKNRSKLITP